MPDTSGRWQARYKGPDGIDRPAPNTFATKGDAKRWLSLTEADIVKDNWLDPDVGRVLFADYGGKTTRAALIYQHRRSLRDKMIADEIAPPSTSHTCGMTHVMAYY